MKRAGVKGGRPQCQQLASCEERGDGVVVSGTHPRPMQIKANSLLLLLADDASPLEEVQTAPSLAALAARGTSFEAAFAAVSSCSPSRSALLTGLPPHQNGQIGLLGGALNFRAALDVPTVPALLNAAGFATGAIGKLHVGPLSTFNFSHGISREHCWASALPSDGPSAPACKLDILASTLDLNAIQTRARIFLRAVWPAKPFFLYVGFGYVHHCGPYSDAYGVFCERFGSSPSLLQGAARRPHTLRPAASEPLASPRWLPETDAARLDLAAVRSSMLRLDDGVGRVLKVCGGGYVTVTWFAATCRRGCSHHSSNATLLATPHPYAAP